MVLPNQMMCHHDVKMHYNKATANHFLKYDNEAAEMNMTVKFGIQVLILML